MNDSLQVVPDAAIEAADRAELLARPRVQEMVALRSLAEARAALADLSEVPATVGGRSRGARGELLDVAWIVAHYGVSAAAAEAIMRECPKVRPPEGVLRKSWVRRADVKRLLASWTVPA